MQKKLKKPIGEMKTEIDKAGEAERFKKKFREFLANIDVQAEINKEAFNEMMAAIEEANKAAEQNKNKFEETGNTIKDGITKPLEKLTDLSLQIKNILDKGIKRIFKRNC